MPTLRSNGPAHVRCTLESGEERIVQFRPTPEGLVAEVDDTTAMHLAGADPLNFRIVQPGELEAQRAASAAPAGESAGMVQGMPIANLSADRPAAGRLPDFGTVSFTHKGTIVQLDESGNLSFKLAPGAKLIALAGQPTVTAEVAGAGFPVEPTMQPTAVEPGFAATIAPDDRADVGAPSVNTPDAPTDASKRATTSDSADKAKRNTR